MSLDRSYERRLARLVNGRSGRSALQGGLKGVQKGSLRVTPRGRIAQTPHPKALGSPLTHEHVTTDYSEALVELVQAIRVNKHAVGDAVQAMRAPIGGEGYDAAILAVSSRKAFSDGLKCLKPRGRLVAFSALPGETPVDLLWLHLKELEIIGACSDQDRYDEAVTMLTDPSLELAELITHRFKLEEFRQALQQADAGKEQAMKVAFIL